MENNKNILKKDCECGGKISAYNYSKHIKTNKHREYFSIDIKCITCDCGSKYIQNSKSYHLTTKTHNLFLLQKELHKMKLKIILKQLKKFVRSPLGKPCMWGRPSR
jgi:hypothetical protein